MYGTITISNITNHRFNCRRSVWPLQVWLPLLQHRDDGYSTGESFSLLQQDDGRPPRTHQRALHSAETTRWLVEKYISNTSIIYR